MKDPRTLKRFLVWVALVVMVCFLGAAQLIAAKEDKKAAAAAQTKDQPSQVGYVGSDTCKGCHEDQFKHIDTTPHFKLNESGKAAATGALYHGCESCHGPGAAHVEGGGDKSKIFRFNDASADAITERCMTCHAFSSEQASFQRSIHLRNGVSCTSCHSPHHAKSPNFLLANKQPALCYQCHNNNRQDFSKPFRHRVNEGLIGCSDCHNVHGGTALRQLRTSAARDQACFKCHTDKKGPFVFEHEPVKVEGCSICHTPHGSNNPRLLNRAQMNSLCLECHTLIPGGPHPQNTKSASCTICHPMIHGSNSHEFFFK